MKSTYSVPILAACLLLAVGSALLRSPEVRDRRGGSLPARTTGDGFATSATCQTCHPEQYDSWHRSYHRTMTQAAAPTSVLGDFDDVTLEDRGYRWRLERRGDQFWVEMPDPVWFDEPAAFVRSVRPDWPDSAPQIEARVVMTTGSHHMQNYWIRRPAGAEAVLDPDNGAFVQLPWVWLIAEERWIPNQDSFLRPPSAALQGATPWNATCSQCHSVGARPGVSALEGRFDTRVVELGVACEACHGPAMEHVRRYRSPLRRYAARLRVLRDSDASDETIVNPAKLEPPRSIEACAQCHSFGEWADQQAYGSSGVPFRPGDVLADHRSVFRFTTDPDDPLMAEMLASDAFSLTGNFWRDGTIRVAGREYNGLSEDPHLEESELTCLTCHSMHGYEAAGDQLDPEALANRACLGCHEVYGHAISEHTRHAPDSSGSECMNCHMPRTTYGLFSATRSHRIDSPSVQVSVDAGRPNACNLCHLDQTLEWSAHYLHEWYGRPSPSLGQDEASVAASVLWALKGDAAQRVTVAWHMGWDAATAASGSWTAAYLAQLLTDPYSAVRQVAYRSIVRLPGFAAFRYDYLAPRPELERMATEATEIWLGLPGDRPGMPPMLIAEDRVIDADAWLRLLEERDLRPLAIVE